MTIKITRVTGALSGAVMALMTLPMAAGAYEQGDTIFRFGAAYVSPNDSSSGVLGDNGIGLIPGNDGVTVDSGWSLGLELDWMLSPNWSVSVLGALPFKHDIEGTGALAGLDVGSLRHLPPTVGLNYHFNPAGSVQPYIGLGLNYTYIYDEKASPALKAAVDGVLGGDNTVALDADNSFGAAAKFGIDFPVNDNWAINTTLWYIDLGTDVDVSVNGSRVTTVDVEVDPWVFMVGGSYNF